MALATKDGTASPIQHVVVLMLENHSFDQMLGVYQSVYKDLDGIDPAAPPRTNADLSGNPIPQAPTTARSVSPDPLHELAHVLRQIEADSFVPGSHTRMHRICRVIRAAVTAGWSWLRPSRPEVKAMAVREYRGAFVADYAESYKDKPSLNLHEIMGYYERGKLPALHALADHFTICDHWFSSVPGPTWANRFFVHTGTSLGIVRMPDHGSDIMNYDLYDQTTIYDRLNEKGIPWRIYSHDVPQSLALSHQWRKENKRRYRKMDQFEQDVVGPEQDFPAYVFIEPQYLEPDPNDDHPPYDIFAAQELIARVYNAIRANESLWNRTLLVVTYDEHGGFYDHISPPEAVTPDKFGNEYNFTRLGVRVPALLVSPWVKAGVFQETLDHTSLLRYLSDQWDLGPLTSRVKEANSFSAAITEKRPRTDTPPSIPFQPPAAPVQALQAPGPKKTDVRNENQQALKDLAQHLSNMAAKKRGHARVRMMQVDGSIPDTEVAAAQVDDFLDAD